jgi:hypothetical protein
MTLSMSLALRQTPVCAMESVQRNAATANHKQPQTRSDTWQATWTHTRVTTAEQHPTQTGSKQEGLTMNENQFETILVCHKDGSPMTPLLIRSQENSSCKSAGLSESLFAQSKEGTSLTQSTSHILPLFLFLSVSRVECMPADMFSLVARSSYAVACSRNRTTLYVCLLFVCISLCLLDSLCTSPAQ